MVGTDDALYDLGDSYELRRGGRCRPKYAEVPVAFGVLTANRKNEISGRIEWLGRVKTETLKPAKNKCEIPKYVDEQLFASVDVHHITRLGDRGADHTDNTVVL